MAKKLKYVYWVCWQSCNQTGNNEIRQSKPIKSYDDIESIIEILKQRHEVSELVIINWKRMKKSGILETSK